MSDIIFRFDREKEADAIRIFEMSHSLYSVLFDLRHELDQMAKGDGPDAAFADMAKDNLLRLLKENGIEEEF
jgi:hypothetical protein